MKATLKAPKVLAKALYQKMHQQRAKKLYEGFIRCLKFGPLYNAEQTATPYSWRFAEGWTGTTRCGKHTRDEIPITAKVF